MSVSCHLFPLSAALSVWCNLCCDEDYDRNSYHAAYCKMSVDSGWQSVFLAYWHTWNTIDCAIYIYIFFQIVIAAWGLFHTCSQMGTLWFSVSVFFLISNFLSWWSSSQSRTLDPLYRILPVLFYCWVVISSRVFISVNASVSWYRCAS